MQEIQRITVHSITAAHAIHEVALLHFADGGHLSYVLEGDDEGGIRFVAGRDSLTRALVAENDRQSSKW